MHGQVEHDIHNMQESVKDFGMFQKRYDATSLQTLANLLITLTTICPWVITIMRLQARVVCSNVLPKSAENGKNK